nr:hypothetical protein [Tanacetum cinerariifolium]
VFVMIIEWESRIDDDSVLDFLSLDSMCPDERSRSTSFFAARLLFLPPGFSPASRLDVLPLEWIGLADLVDLVYVVKSKSLCIDDGIVSDHAKVQDRLDEELGNENDVVLFCLSVMCQTKPDGVNHATVNEDTHHDEELEIHEAKVKVHLFGIKENDYHFTTIRVSSEVPDNVFIEEGVYEIDINDFDTESGGEGDNLSRRRSSLNKLKKDFMQAEADGKNMLSIVVKFLVAQRKLKIGCIFTLLKLEGS